MNKKFKIVAILIVFIIVSFLVLGVMYVIWQDVIVKSDDTPPASQNINPQSTSESSFRVGDYGYGCSREIDGRWVEEEYMGPAGSARVYAFKPSNYEDFKKYCREVYIIEYKSVIDILRRDDISQLIEKYNTTEAWVRALSHVYINDKDYIRRILPAYSEFNIDCIIVVHTPEITRFFIEKGEEHASHDDHQYLEIPASEFLSSLNSSSDKDINNFWFGLH